MLPLPASTADPSVSVGTLSATSPAGASTAPIDDDDRVVEAPCCLASRRCWLNSVARRWAAAPLATTDVGAGVASPPSAREPRLLARRLLLAAPPPTRLFDDCVFTTPIRRLLSARRFSRKLKPLSSRRRSSQYVSMSHCATSSLPKSLLLLLLAFVFASASLAALSLAFPPPKAQKGVSFVGDMLPPPFPPPPRRPPDESAKGSPPTRVRAAPPSSP